MDLCFLWTLAQSSMFLMAISRKRMRNLVAEHVCMRAGRTNWRKAREPFEKSVCAGVQLIKSLRVARMMSFWSFEARNWQCGGVELLVAHHDGW